MGSVPGRKCPNVASRRLEATNERWRSLRKRPFSPPLRRRRRHGGEREGVFYSPSSSSFRGMQTLKDARLQSTGHARVRSCALSWKRRPSYRCCALGSLAIVGTAMSLLVGWLPALGLSWPPPAPQPLTFSLITNRLTWVEQGSPRCFRGVSQRSLPPFYSDGFGADDSENKNGYFGRGIRGKDKHAKEFDLRRHWRKAHSTAGSPAVSVPTTLETFDSRFSDFIESHQSLRKKLQKYEFELLKTSPKTLSRGAPFHTPARG